MIKQIKLVGFIAITALILSACSTTEQKEVLDMDLFIVFFSLAASYFLLFKFLIKECYLDKGLSKGKEKIIGENP